MSTAATSAVPEMLELLKTITGARDNDIAEHIGMNRSTFINRRKGRSELTLTEAMAISELFGVPVEIFAASPEAARQWLFEHWVEVKSSYQSEYFGKCPFDQLELVQLVAA